MKTINLASMHPNPWLRQFPDSIPQWDGWRYVFNAENEDYDYLVVFDNFRAPLKPNCPKENIIHLATEPPTVCHYSDEFLAQFAWTIRQGADKDIEGAIYHHPGLTWHLGWKPGETDLQNMLIFEQIKLLFDQPKSKCISVIASNKAFTSEHKARLEFAQKLKEHYGDKIDFYGRGFVTMDDKLDSLKDYRFQVVLENSSFEHYFSEKLTDCILAGTYPVYYGCPDLDKYFTQNSYRRIDIHNFEDSIKIIDNAIKEEWDKKFRSELLEARDLILYKYNLFPMLIGLIQNIENGKYGLPNSAQQIQNSVLIPLAQDTLGKSIRFMLSGLADKYRLFGLLRNLINFLKAGVHEK